MNRKIFLAFLIAALLLVSLPLAANAVLQAVGPIDATNGFPVWYQDTDGLTLDLCLPKNQAQLDSGVCLIVPTDPGPPVVPGFDVLPVAFPGNFPDESFYWNATAVSDLSLAGDNAVLVLGLEAAFSTGNVVPGAQIVFSRLRIVVDAPLSGDYTVTTPYGTFEFPNVAAGKRAIVQPLDIGIGAPGDFTGALGGHTGPFLQASATEGGVALPPVTIPLDTSGDLFLSDGVLTTVTGSPGNTNYFRICTTGGNFDINGSNCVTQNLFVLIGRVFNGTPFVADKAHYIRNAAGAGVVNAYGSTNTSSATAVYEAGGTGLTTTTMSRTVATGDLFAQIPFTTGTILPAAVTLTATDTGKTPTAVLSNLTDLVTITSAAYDKSRLALIIKASSSDQFALPALTATGLGALVNGQLEVSPVVAPPASITVTSAKGGSATAVVTVFSSPKIGVYSDGLWYLDNNNNGAWDGPPTDLLYSFGEGLAGAVPVTGDWNGTSQTKIGIYADGLWYLDNDGNGAWDGTPTDLFYSFGVGLIGAVPVTGDWNGSGTTKIGVYAGGVWYLDTNGNGAWDGAPIDTVFIFGGSLVNPIPVTGDWDGNGTTNIGIYSDGVWFLDTNGSTVEAFPADRIYNFGLGLVGAIPVAGGISGASGTVIGVFLNDGTWYIDYNPNGVWDGTPTDLLYFYGGGLIGAIPVTGQW
ncbi:MAG: hypothetical protein EPN25_06490 [Nitrospirae bacterium]|nr:MAG: hypothetical protein EPN25_06490 [Nitrospirota bacterium]